MRKLVCAVVLLFATCGVAFAASQYNIAISSPPAQVNVPSVARVSVRPAGQFHINTEYPVKLTIHPPGGVTVEKRKLTKIDAKRFEEGGLDFEVPFTAGASGKKPFTGELKFGVRSGTEAVPAAEQLAFDVDVK